MKRVFFSGLLILVASLLSGCVEESDIENLQGQIDEIKSSQIASIQQQIEAVNASVINLQSVDTELRSYVTNLQEKVSVLQTIDEELHSSLQKLRDDIADSIAVSNSNFLSQLEDYKLIIENQIHLIEESIGALQKYDESIQNRITELKTYVDKEVSDAKDWASATFVTLDQYNTTASIIASLQSQISVINEHIANLDIPENIVSKEEMDKAIASLDETLKGKINKVVDDCSSAIATVKTELVAAYTQAIQDAISSSESSMKTWVNSQLTGYYTISQSDALLASLKTSLEEQMNNQKTQLQNLLASLESALTRKIEENASDIEECRELIATCNELIDDNAKAIKANSDDIAQLRTDLANSKEEITTAYKNAIATAINNLDGKLTGKIAEEVETINTRITEEITVVNGEIADLKTRTAACEKDIKSIKTSIYNMQSEIEELQEKVADILARIQSVAFVPEYSDGRAVMYYTKNSSITPGTAQLTYEFVPSGTAGEIAKVWQTALSMKAIYTVTRAPEAVNLTIESATAENGYLTVIVSGIGLSDAFFLYQRSVNVSLKISDGNNELATDYVQLIPWTTDAITFGDANFKTYCLEHFDTNTDGEISIEEAASVVSIDATSLGITSFVGIEYFSGLENLDVSYNKATSLDLSHSPLLTEVKVNNNQLTTINLAGCSGIVTLDCSSNSLTELDCSEAKALQELACANNSLGQLNLKNNKALVGLQCSGNNLAVLDLNNNTAIASLFCRKNSLATIDLTKLPGLAELDCSNNSLSSLNVSNNPTLESLRCSSNSISSLNLINNTELSYLDCSGNALKSLDVTKNTMLEDLDCSNNQIASLDISRNASLETVTCNNNDGMTKLWVKDAAQQASLTIRKDDGTVVSFNNGGIQIPDANLKAYLLALFDEDEDGEISIIEAENVQNVNCSRRSIADLTGLQDCPNLKYLNCSENNVSVVNLPNLSKLETVVAYGNPIEKLVFNNDKELKALYLQDANTNVLNGASITINNYLQATSLYIAFAGTDYTDLDISNNTQWTHYDISENIQLKRLVANNNPSVTSVNLASMPDLDYLDVSSCGLSTLNVDNNTKLVTLKCSGNNLTALNTDQNVDIVEFNCSNNQLSTLRVTQNALLESFDASNNQLQTINLRQNPKLKTINVSGNASIMALALGYNTSLESLDASSTGLTDIDVTANTLLKDLNLSGCGQLQVIDLRNNTQLITLNLSSTSVLSLDAGNCSNLNSLDLTGVGTFNSINVNNCPITSLKISGDQDSLLGQCVIPGGVESVIFYASNSAVKVVSADEGSGQWAKNTFATSDMSAKSSSDGYYNMRVIKSYTLSFFPAFEWCANKGNKWYLPSYLEIESLFNVFETINNALSSIGGVRLKKGSAYWTSTETSGSGAVEVYYNNTGVHVNNDYSKTNSGCLRAIRSL